MTPLCAGPSSPPSPQSSRASRFKSRARAKSSQKELVPVDRLREDGEPAVGVAEGVAVAVAEVGDQAEEQRVVPAVVLPPRLAGQPRQRPGQPGGDRVLQPGV